MSKAVTLLSGMSALAMKTSPYILFIGTCLLFLACSSELDTTAIRVTEDEPSEVFSAQQLGRYLFYDQTLSLNNNISCGSCHQQQFSFADNQVTSKGFISQDGRRNTPALVNISGGFIAIEEQFTSSRFAGALFWDGRESDLVSMVIKPILDHGEMGLFNTDQIVSRIANNEFYREVFYNVFRQDTITIDMIANVMAIFVGSIQSQETKLDRALFVEGLQFALSSEELEGFALFTGKYNCNVCHQVESPSGYKNASGGSFANIGLDLEYEDNGLGAITGNAQDNGKFKIPSLRNLEYTAPYMHDGRFETLEQVMDHYASGVKAHENLDPRFMDADGNVISTFISEKEKASILAFLKTLNDESILTDPQLSNPYSYQ